jgi:hypothetical protein
VPRLRLGGHPYLAVIVMKKLANNSAAYRCGWIDGCYEELGCFTENRRLAEWERASDRLDYYRGHRAGREARRHSDLIVRAS